MINYNLLYSFDLIVNKVLNITKYCHFISQIMYICLLFYVGHTVQLWRYNFQEKCLFISQIFLFTDYRVSKTNLNGTELSQTDQNLSC